jgi:proteasome lid subunit RPN8/RPN11
MNDIVRETLTNLIARYGPALGFDYRRLEGLLREYVGEHRREINVLITAAREGVPENLVKASGTKLDELLGHRLVQQLYENVGMDGVFGSWAVESWAIALRKGITAKVPQQQPVGLPQTVQIPKSIHAEMVAHARNGFPNQICGIVLGPPGKMWELHRASNSTPRDPFANWDVDPRDLLVIYERADETYWDFVAIYHSNPPFSPVYPSPADIAGTMHPDAIHIILSIGPEDHTKYFEALRNPQASSNILSELGDPQTAPPRIRAFRIIKENVLSKEGRVVELRIEVSP